MSCALVENESWGVGLARLFLEKGATLKARDRYGLNALHYACIYERVRLTETILKATDFNLNQQDRFGNTALHYSVTNGNTEVTKLLIETLVKYKQTVDVRNTLGVTPLLQAWKNGHSDCAQMLVELGHATQDIIDPQVNKCSRDYEIELLAKANLFSQETLRSVSTLDSYDSKLPGYMRPKSKVKMKPNQRTQSAPAGGRSDRSSTMTRAASAKFRPGNAFPFDENNYNHRKIIGKEDISPRLYRDAGHFNPRNIPERVFKSTPVQCFTDIMNGNNNVTSSTDSSSSAMTAEVNHPHSGWRSEVKTLFNSYDFQWTESYRKSIIPPPESIALTGEEEDGLYDLRPMSPTTESDGKRLSKKSIGLKNLQNALGAFGDGLAGGVPVGARTGRRSSIISTGGRSSRRGSVASVASLLLSEPHSGTSSEGSIKKKSKPVVPRAWRSGAHDGK